MKIAVLFGGPSPERDVSIQSGAQVIRSLRAAGHEAVAVDISTGVLSPREEDAMFGSTLSGTPPDYRKGASIISVLHEVIDSLEGVDLYFLALHGVPGEDGSIQAFLDLAGLRYTGSGMKGSAVAMDKDLSKRLFRFAGVPTPDWRLLSTPDKIECPLPCPVVVKPNNQGSTIGLTVVKDPAQFMDAVEEAFRYDDEVIVEAFVPGREFTVGILDDKPLSVGEIVPQKGEIFNYESKYQPGGALEIFPAELDDSQTSLLKDLALRAHRALKLKGYSRVDFMRDKEGDFWCLEANTLPGMTATSLLPQSAGAVGIDFIGVCLKICETAGKN
jgi:D-alanine-D-alanine ligase